MTNREKLQQMTDEKLGVFLCQRMFGRKPVKCSGCIGRKQCHLAHIGLIDWLRAEEKEEEEDD